jgi:hypothetical protein
MLQEIYEAVRPGPSVKPGIVAIGPVNRLVSSVDRNISQALGSRSLKDMVRQEE